MLVYQITQKKVLVWLVVSEASIRGQSEPLARQNLAVGTCDRRSSLSPGRGGRRDSTTLLFNNMLLMSRNCPSRPHFLKVSPHQYLYAEK